jgi:hypothetical protein
MDEDENKESNELAETYSIDDDAPQKKASNRTFLIILAGIVGLLAVILLCLGVVVGVLLPRQRAQTAAVAATRSAQNTVVALQVAATSTNASQRATLAAIPTNTPTRLPPTATLTSTPVLAAPTQAPATVDPRTATVSALLTQAANITTKTPVGPVKTAAPTALPKTGLMEDLGLPGQAGLAALIGMAVLLLAVVFAARWLRQMR